jgi:hypothetical protein
MRNKMLRAAGGGSSAPDNIPWAYSLDGWVSFASGSAGTGQKVDLEGGDIRAYARPVTSPNLTNWGAYQINNREDFNLIPGATYRWAFYSQRQVNNDGAYEPWTNTARLFTYTDSEASQGQNLIKEYEVPVGENIGNQVFDFVMPEDANSIRWEFTAGNYRPFVTGIEWTNLSLTRL